MQMMSKVDNVGKPECRKMNSKSPIITPIRKFFANKEIVGLPIAHRKNCYLLDWSLRLALGFIWVLLLAFSTPAVELSNDTLILRLTVTPEGIPAIKEALWRTSGRVVFRDMGTPAGLKAWIPASLIPSSQTKPANWRIQAGEHFTTAEATRELVNNILITWIIDLPKQGQLFRLRIRLVNGDVEARAVQWFPVWSARWDTGEQSEWARWWQSLEYDQTERPLTPNRSELLQSQMHSSDVILKGVNPYWIVGSKSRRIHFGLQWSGGWNAKLEGLKKGFTFSVFLPPEETQLVLSPGESIEGPALLVTPTADADDAQSRALWMRNRQNLGQKLYAGPPPSFPLSYNTWYAARRFVDQEFINRQIAAMSPYAFTAFVIDAGWFDEGRWEADKTKFPGNSLATIFASLKAKGIKAGLWTTPQYVTPATNSAALTIEQPQIFNNFLGGYLVDMSSPKYTMYLNDHVKRLRSQYAIDYWKYDQRLFDQQTIAGKMKNVIGFQQALYGVRRANPDLFIENCYNGGRMLNEFTLLLTQTSWLRDLGRLSQPATLLNIRAALNALEFVFPWAALRFTIHMHKLGQNDDEMMRLDCRSAMAGSWGLSTDLSALGERQRAVILKEVENYRRLNQLKYACLYDLQLPKDHADIAGITFYDSKGLQAGVLLYRWQRQGAFNPRITLTKLKPGLRYKVVDVDQKTETTISGASLKNKGLEVAFSSQRQSALLFIEPAK
jgi:alpha-galactosidase